MESQASSDVNVATMTAPSSSSDLKRKRSPSIHESPHLQPAAPPTPKQQKPHNHLQINYLVRHYDEDLPIITKDDSMPALLRVLNDYQAVLDRHESMAGNLGARPLGPILIKRFERLFDGPPKVLKCHGKEGTTVTWLDVVEFARNKPDQFALGQMSEGVKVCQFYTKQCRVQISEEDYVLISSGIPQKMIPPQPISEDEEKELGTLEILENRLNGIVHLADQVAARGRQLNHRLKSRKQAIIDRRATEPSYTVAAPASIRAGSPSNVALMNGQAAAAGHAGFVAVNSRPVDQLNGADIVLAPPTNKGGTSPRTREELLSKFHTLNEIRDINGAPSDARGIATPRSAAQTPGHGNGAPKAQRQPQQYENDTYTALLLANASPAPYPTTVHRPPHPSPHHSHSHQSPSVNASSTADDGPYKQAMVMIMEKLAKGSRVLPPCDRCRRLHMDCLKNLTACQGCTKKHAKCSWKEVREDELRMYSKGIPGLDPMLDDDPDLQAHTSRSESGGPLTDTTPMPRVSPPIHQPQQRASVAVMTRESDMDQPYNNQRRIDRDDVVSERNRDLDGFPQHQPQQQQYPQMEDLQVLAERARDSDRDTDVRGMQQLKAAAALSVAQQAAEQEKQDTQRQQFDFQNPYQSPIPHDQGREAVNGVAGEQRGDVQMMGT